MSIKKLTLNTKEILGRVGTTIGNTENIRIAERLGVKPQVCTNWKTRNSIPWAELFSFSQETSVSLDWLLTGREKPNAFGSNWPDHVKRACRDLSRILTSENEALQQAILANLAVFKLTLEQEERIASLEREVLERRKRESQKHLDSNEPRVRYGREKGR
jgi:hypothetical protein